MKVPANAAPNAGSEKTYSLTSSCFVSFTTSTWRFLVKRKDVKVSFNDHLSFILFRF